MKTTNTDEKDKSTHELEMRRPKGGLRTANTDGREQKHAHTRDEEIKGGSEDSKHRWGRTKARTP